MEGVHQWTQGRHPLADAGVQVIPETRRRSMASVPCLVGEGLHLSHARGPGLRAPMSIMIVTNVWMSISPRLAAAKRKAVVN